MPRTLTIALEAAGDKFAIVFRAPGVEPLSIEYDTRAEADAALRRAHFAALDLQLTGKFRVKAVHQVYERSN